MIERPVYKRFISMNIINGLVRPQKESECAINSILGAINAVTGDQYRRNDIYQYTSIDEDDVINGRIGNGMLIDTINEFAAEKRVDINAKLLWPHGMPDYNDKLWHSIQKLIHEQHNALILHKANHYKQIAGYFEEPWDFSCMDKAGFRLRRDWLIMADHEISEGDGMPMYMETWRNVYDELEDDEAYGIIKVSKK